MHYLTHLGSCCRHRLHGLALMLAALAFAPSARPQERGIQLLDVLQGDVKYALLIGINRYQSERLPGLNYAVNDAKKLSEALKEAGYQVTTLTSDQSGSSQPTRDNLVREFKALAGRVTPNDTLLFFFAGHGFTLPGKGSFLATMDTDLAKAEDTAVSVGLLGTLTEEISCRQAALVFDACRNSVRSVVTEGSGPLPETLANELRAMGEKERGTAVLFACRAGQFATETPEKQQGLFSYYLVRGFQGEAANPKGEVTLSSLMDFAQASVEASSERKQQPWLNFNGARMILGMIKQPGPASAAPRPAATTAAPEAAAASPDSELLVNVPHTRSAFKVGDAAVRGGIMKGSLTFDTLRRGEQPLTFELNQKYRYFETTLGVDNKTRREETTVQFSVEGDGKPIGEPVMLTVNSKPQTLSIDVSKVDRLSLVIRASRKGVPVTLPNGIGWWGRPIVSRDPGPAKPIGLAPEVSQPPLKSNRMVYLSALRPVVGQATPGIAPLKGKEVPNSITSGTGDRSEPVYTLNSEYETFQATVGVSDNTRDRYEVVFVLEADGKKLRSFGPVGANSQPLDTGAVSVKGVDRLKLKIEAFIPGNRGARSAQLARGHAWWGGARFEKSSSTP